MHALIAEKRESIAEICRRYGVRRLEVFGSAARGRDFDPARSDADFLVAFDRETSMSPLERHFGLAEALEAVLGRKVDLVQEGAVRNPYILARINAVREPVYGA